MTELPFTTWFVHLQRLEDALRRLDLRLHTDASLEPAPSDTADQVHTALWAKAAVTSQGTPVLELEYSGCFRLRYRHPAADAADGAPVPAGAPATAAPRLSLAQ